MSLPFRSLFLAVLCTASAHGASVIVNEINAGGASVPGDWFELVVVGNGTGGSTVDMRGWEIRIDNDGSLGAGYFKLSNNAYWSNVQAGTILTFHENNAAGGGVDTAILATNQFATLGWAHSNIWVSDGAYVDLTWATHDGDFPMDQDDSQVAIFDALGNLVFGPAGEHHVGYTAGGVNETEIFKLEADPSPSITLTSPYKDGSTSTFGAPNAWSSGTITQNFSAFVFVPEPSSVAMLLGSLGAFTLIRRRK